MSGWYKRQRNIPERPWFTDAQVLQLYDYLEAKAYVSDGMYEGQLIRRGSCPTTRPEMMEATGLSYKQVDRCLRVLSNYGEIIVRGNNRFSVISVCSYCNSEQQLSLFGTAEDTSGGTTRDTAGGTAEGTAHLLTIEERYKDNLITPYSPYKNEREKEDEALEVKKRYNKTFDGKLPPCVRLTMPTRLMVVECIRRFGKQSVDIVFEQVLAEPFSLGLNKTGFQASFQYIFEPKHFQQYLERAMLRLKKTADVKASESDVTRRHAEQEHLPVRQSREEYDAEMRRYAAEHPDSPAARIVKQWDEDKNNNQ